MSKPLVIKLREAKTRFTESVNESLRDGIPCYLLEPIVKELLEQVKKVADEEFERAVKQQVAAAKAAVETSEEAGGEKDERAEK
jgi:hypothetical protein